MANRFTIPRIIAYFKFINNNNQIRSPIYLQIFSDNMTAFVQLSEDDFFDEWLDCATEYLTKIEKSLVENSNAIKGLRNSSLKFSAQSKLTVC